MSRDKPRIGFREELRIAINRHSQENYSNTPDFVLAQFLVSCLKAFDVATIGREEFYGIDCSPDRGCVRRSEP